MECIQNICSRWARDLTKNTRDKYLYNGFIGKTISQSSINYMFKILIYQFVLDIPLLILAMFMYVFSVILEKKTTCDEQLALKLHHFNTKLKVSCLEEQSEVAREVD